MKIKGHLIGIPSLILGLLFTTVALAHNTLKLTEPANGAVFDHVPENIGLSFIDNTYLIKLELKTASGEIIVLDFTPSIQAAKTFSVALPVTLENDHYTVSWTIEGEDTHQISGEYNFIINSQSLENTGTI